MINEEMEKNKFHRLDGKLLHKRISSCIKDNA